MEHLWAPWRNNYVSQTTGRNTATLFADIAKSNDDEENLVVLRGKSCFGILNRYPYNTGHLMVVPYRVTGKIEELGDDEILELMNMMRYLKTVLTTAFAPHGFNIGINLGAAAGAGIVEHMHLHLVPRWRSDSNFMTTTADTRIHPSDLGQVYAKVKQVIAETPAST
jgi:ATP adenylyltransferase